MRRIFICATLAWLSTLGTQTVADTVANPTQLPDTIVVTANRFGQSPKQAIWPATALNRQTMANDVSLQQTLDGRFGLDLRQTSGVGSITTLSNWGTFNRHMLLLYNGRVVRDYSLGGFNLSDFSADEFERVELLKGPQSAFYGADAIGGVVNLISRNALVDRLELVTRYGEFDLKQYRLDASKLLGQVGVGGFAEWGKAENNRPNAGSERAIFGLRTDYLSHDGRHKLSVSARYFSDSLGVPGPVPDPVSIPVYGNKEATNLNDNQKDENYSADLSYHFAPSQQSEVQIDLFWEKKNLDYHSLYNYQFSNYTPDGADSVLNADSVDVHSRSIYNKRSAGVSGRFQHQFKSVTASAGVDFLSGSLRATSDDKSYGTKTVGPFASYGYDYISYNFWSRGQDQFDLWSSTVLRLNKSVQYDLSGRLQFVHNRKAQPSYNVGMLVSPRETVRFKFGYGYAFRLPSIADQFADEIYVKGRANLNPETSKSAVASVELDGLDRHLFVRIAGFSQRVDSLIQYLYDPNIFRSVPQNVHRFKSEGVDLTLSYKFLQDYYLTVGAVYQKAKQTAAPGQYVDAYYVPDLKWRADWGGKVLPKFDFGLNLSHTSTRSIILYTGESKAIASVYEIGATIGYEVSKLARLSLTGYDLTDRRRPDQFGFVSNDGDYPSPGRRVVAQLHLTLR